MTQKRKRFLVSGVISSLLLLQGIAAFGVCSSNMWPFLDYPMYRRSRAEGDAVHRYALVGILNGGSEVTIPPEALGLGFWHFMKGPVEALQEGDSDRAQVYARIYHDRHNIKLAALRLENNPVHLKRKGFEEGPKEILETLWFNDAWETFP